MTIVERITFFTLLLLRSISSILDLLGVVAIGYVATSIALFVQDGSNQSRQLNFADISIPAVNITTLPLLVGVILGLFLAKAALAILLTRAMAYKLAKIEARATRHIAEKVLGESLEESKSLSRESLQYVTFAGASAAFSGLLSSLTTIISEGALFLGLLITFAFVDLTSTIYIVIFFGILAALIHLFSGRQLSKTGRVLAESSIKSYEALNNLHNAYRELSVLRKKSMYFDRLEESKMDSASAVGKQQLLVAMPRYLVETAVIFGIFAFAGFKLLTGDLGNAAAILGIFLTGSLRLMAAMLPWQMAFSSMKGLAAQAQLASPYLNSSLIDLGPTIQRQGSRMPSGVVLSNVSYQYPGAEKTALSDITFTIEPGSHVALIGPSGAGKSTVADLMMGLISPSTGSILIDGLEPRAIHSLAYVPQRPGALSGTILENITVGTTREVDESRLISAIELANLSDLIGSLKDGVNTDMGTHSDSFSGGQLQRIGLARALYAQPTFLVLDEATSALDAESEHQIVESLKRLRGRVTVVTIAHRLNTVKSADKIIFLSGGQFVDSGNFNEIRRRNNSIEKAIDLVRINEAH